MIGLAAGTLYTPGAVTIGFDNLRIWDIRDRAPNIET